MDLHKIFNTDHLAATPFFIFVNLLLSQVIVHQNLFLKCARYKCEQAKIPVKSIHAIRRTLNSRIGKEITIIVLTSYEFSEIEEEAKAAAVDAFIAKPLFRSRLTATLRQFTSGRKEKTARNYLEELSESDYTGKRILLVEDNE